MEMTHRNYLKDDLVCNADGQTVNQPINYTQRKTFYKEAKLTPEADRTQAMKQELAKCVSAQAKVDELKTKDLSKTETVADYRVK
jgi:purine nucleoside phosphorylase